MDVKRLYLIVVHIYRVFRGYGLITPFVTKAPWPTFRCYIREIKSTNRS